MQRLLRSASILAVAAIAATTGPASAQMRSRELVPIDRAGHAPEGRGCYWADGGRGYCRAYCYIEADGRRFCTERSRFAEPQAPWVEEAEDRRGHRRLK